MGYIQNETAQLPWAVSLLMFNIITITKLIAVDAFRFSIE